VAAVPLQFALHRTAPYSARRSENDARFEQGAGYLSPAALGLDNRVFAFGNTFTTAPIWTPGWATFTGFFNCSSFPGAGNVFVVIQHLDPETQAVVFGLITSPAVIIADDTVQVFNFGSGGTFDFATAPSQASMKYLLWNLVIINIEGALPNVTVSLELIANSRVTL
jgi:hypothetical protein